MVLGNKCNHCDVILNEENNPSYIRKENICKHCRSLRNYEYAKKRYNEDKEYRERRNLISKKFNKKYYRDLKYTHPERYKKRLELLRNYKKQQDLKENQFLKSIPQEEVKKEMKEARELIDPNELYYKVIKKLNKQN